MKASLVAVCFIFLSAFSCTDLKKLAGKPPNPNFCNILVDYGLSEDNSDPKIDDVYLVCLDKKTQKEYTVDGVSIERYFAIEIKELIEVITWIRKIEVILEDAEVGFLPTPKTEALKELKKIRHQLIKDYNRLREKSGHKR